MLLLLRGSQRSSKPVGFLHRAPKSGFDPGAGGLWEAPTLTHVSGSLSTASGRCPTCVLGLGVHLTPTLASSNCVRGGRAAGGMRREEGKVFFLGKRQAEIDTLCHFFWQVRGVWGGLEVRGARSSPGSSIVFLSTQLF